MEEDFVSLGTVLRTKIKNIETEMSKICIFFIFLLSGFIYNRMNYSQQR